MNIYRSLLLLAALVLAVQEMTSALNIMKGNSGHTAVELLLATGILAKLLNIKNKVGSPRILHALLGGYRYPPRYHPQYGYGSQQRYPSTQSLLDDELLDQTPAGLPLSSNHAGLDQDLMLNEESHLISKSHMFLPTDYQMYASQPPILTTAEAHQVLSSDVQQLLAARRLRKILAAQEARKLMAAQQIRRLLQTRQLLAAQEFQDLLSAQNQRNIMAPSYHTPSPYVATAGGTATGQAVATVQGPPRIINSRSSEEPTTGIITAEELRELLAAESSRTYVSSSGSHAIVSSSALPLLETDNGKQMFALRREGNDFLDHGFVMKYHLI